MTQPNPVWGIHASPGAIVGALVARRDDGAYEVVDALEDTASDNVIEVLAAATECLDRRGVRGRAALLAIPDTEGCYTTAEIPDDELYMNEDELFRELYEYTPFEPEDGVIVYRRLSGEAERKYAVCALPVGHMNEVMIELATLDPSYHGIGVTSASLVRGARALGLVGEHGFLLDVQIRLSVLYALDGENCNRYLIPVGIDDTRKDPVQASALARDVLQQVSYHLEQHLGAEGHSILDPQKDIVLVGPHADGDLRARMAAIFVDRLAPADWRLEASESITGPDGAALDPDQTLRSVAAIGAALEAYQDRENRLVVRHPPDEVPEYVGDGRPWWHWAAAALLVIALVAAGFHFFGGDDGGTKAATLPADADADERRETLEHAALRSAYAQGVEALLELAAAAPKHLQARRVEMAANGVDYDVTFTLRGEPRMADVASMGTATDALTGISATGVQMADDLLRVRYKAHPRGAPPTDGAEVPRKPARKPGAPLLGVMFVRQRLAGVGHLEPARDDAPHELSARLRAEASIEALAAVGFPVDSPPPETVTLEVNGDDTDLTAKMGGPSAGSAPLSEAEAGYVRRAAGRADALDSLEFERATGAFGSLVAAGPLLEVAATAAGRVLVQYAAGADQRVLQASVSGTDDWWVVAVLGAGAGETVDYVPGPEGDYVWRVLEGEATVAESAAVRVPVPVEVEIDGPAEGQDRARFRLTRAWRGDIASATVELGVGDTIETRTQLPDDYGSRWLSFRSPWRITKIRTRTVTEEVTVQVPRLRPDGKVERGADGQPVLEERRAERPRAHLEVEATAPDHPTQTWVRKMTDG